MSKHTPGPWFPIEFSGFFQMLNEPFYEGKDLLSRDQDENAEANAKLMSAAPEMYEALKAFVNFKKHDGETLLQASDRLKDKIMKALAKAEGKEATNV